MEHINDIAVLEVSLRSKIVKFCILVMFQLENEITFFHPVKLVSEGFVCERDRQGVLVGWGLTVSQNDTLSYLVSSKLTH